jgi:hypothetical protein
LLVDTEPVSKYPVSKYSFQNIPVGSTSRCPVFIARDLSGFAFVPLRVLRPFPPSSLWECPIKGDVKDKLSSLTGRDAAG